MFFSYSLFIAVITFVVWFLIKREVEPALFHSIQVLVISCPCALGLATPVAITASIGACAKEGILIKNSHVFEILNEADTIIFDKTGTRRFFVHLFIYFTDTYIKPYPRFNS